MIRQNHDRVMAGVLLMLGFCILAPWIDVASKLAVASLPVAEVTLARYIVQGALMLPVVLLLRQSMRVSGRALHVLFWRSLASVASTFTFVWAMIYMPIADALAIAFVEPFLLLFVGKFLFKEEVGPRRLGASIVGFCGALLIIQPSFVTFGWVAFLPLVTAASFAAYMLLTREAAQLCKPEEMQFHGSWLSALICLPLIGYGWLVGDPLLGLKMPEGLAWIWLLGVGVAATISHIMITYALRFAPSSTLAPLHYMEIVMAAVLGYLIFDDFPNMLTWAGIAVIVASGLYIIHRERVIAKTRR